MASTFTDLGLELMATGENAGTWGTKTNANLSLIEQLTGGVLEVSIAGGAGTTTLDIDDGALTGTAQQRVLELTGSITGNRVVTWPLLTENFYIVKNGTSGAYTVQLKAASGSGATVTFSATDKGYKLIYLDGVATNTGLFEAALGEENEVTLTGTETLTNKTLTSPVINTPTTTSPKIITNILDTNGNELINVTATGSAVNEFTIANGASGGGPRLSATGETNVDLDLLAKGTGHVTIMGATNPGSLQLNCEQNSHGIKLTSPAHSANQSYELKFPTGNVTADKFLKVASVSGSGTTGVGQLSFAAAGTSWQAIKTGNYTAVAGQGVFANTTSGAFTVTLPSSPTLGDEVSIVDYAGTFDSNNLTVGRNSQPIQGAAADLVVNTERAAFTLAYVDSTQGWLLKNN